MCVCVCTCMILTCGLKRKRGSLSLGVVWLCVCVCVYLYDLDVWVKARAKPLITRCGCGSIIWLLIELSGCILYWMDACLITTNTHTHTLKQHTPTTHHN